MSQRMALVAASTILATGVMAPVALAGQEKVTICHRPGSPAERTMVVARPALKSHLAHGDSLKRCGDFPVVPVLDACVFLNEDARDGEYAARQPVTLHWLGDETVNWATQDPLATTTPSFVVTLDGVSHDSDCPGQTCSLGLTPVAGDAAVGWSTVSDDPVLWDVFCEHGGNGG